MRTYSTPQSALNLEITKLAIIECVASVALYIGIGVYFGTFKYLAVAVVFAPLMLFRTNVSAEWGLQVYKRFFERLTDWSDNMRDSVAMILVAVLTPIVGTAIRIGATVYWLVRMPLQTLRDTPENWVRQGLCTDFAHPPEILPLEASHDPSDEFLVTFSKVTKFIKEDQERAWGRLRLAFAFSPFFVIGWLPSVTYRLSFKATSIAYAPFMWVAHSTLGSPLSLKTRLERITKGEFEKVRRGLSWIILSTLLAKFLFLIGWVEGSYLESKFPSKKFIASFVVLDSWPWWQITLGIDVVLTFTLLFYADAALARLESGKTWREETVLKSVSTLTFLRAALGIITMSHFFLIALRAAAPRFTEIL